MSRPYISSFSIQYPSQEQIRCVSLSQNVNVIYGNNEAGKSRVKDFLEWIMLAQSEELSQLKTAATKKAFSHLDPNISGSVELVIDGERIEVSQKLIEGITQTHLNTSRISAKDVSRVLTDGLSRDHYNNIFALSLDELTRTESNKLITENEMMNMFFGASINGAGISPPALLGELTKRKEEMFSEAKQAKNKQINRVLKEISDNAARIKELRQEENGIETIDSDIEQHAEKLAALELELGELNKKVVLSKEILENIESFGRFEQINDEDEPEINLELITRMMDINMLVHTCKELIDQGDEREKERLEASINSLEQEHQSQKAELAATVSPGELGETIGTPQLLSVVEEEDRARTEYGEKIRNIQENVGNYSADLGLLAKEADQLNIEIKKLDSTPQEDRAVTTPERSESNKRKISWVAAVASVFGLAGGTFALLSNQPIGAIVGYVFGLAAVVYQFVPSKSHEKNISSTEVSHNQLLNQQLVRELESKTTKMSDLQMRIEKLVDEQTSLDSKRELKAQKYFSAISEAGFPTEATPHLVSLYINAYKGYISREQRITELKATLLAASTRLKALFERANNLKKLAQGTSCEVQEDFKSVQDIYAWASSLHELSLEHKQREEMLHKKDNELRELEKKLSTSFSSIENAKDIYTNMDLNELEAQYEILQSRQQEALQNKQDLQHEIIRLNLQRDNASNSTAIADATQDSQRLIDELKFLHEKYQSLFVAQKVVANALENFLQENQPELLRVASSMMAKITRGQWDSITLTQSESSKNTDPIIRVSGSKAQHGLSISQLSRGTREQLYLCLRLALMETSSRGKQIPALFDDIAVNSDRARFEALAPVIGEIGQNRQVIYFTCHETTRDILANYARAQIISI